VPITNSNEDNETAVLSKWLNSHPARLPMFFKVTRLTAGDCHHDFRLGLFGRVNEFYKKGCQEKSSPSTGSEVSFSINRRIKNKNLSKPANGGDGSPQLNHSSVVLGVLRGSARNVRAF
jgi:hypothetical protein